MQEAIRTFGAALAALDAELDWELLGHAYAEGEAGGFFADELRARITDTGLLFADDLARALPRDGPRRSLYLGAAVAELAPILAERVVLGREVVWLNLPGDETDELRRALEVVGARLGVELPKPSIEGLEICPAASCDHLWMVSVLTDPDVFPALHDELYERAGGPLATGRGRLEEERERAEALATALLERAASPSVLSTTDEELELLRPLAQRLGFELDVPRETRRTAIVGDDVRMCALRGVR